jgi:hypothetical protein
MRCVTGAGRVRDRSEIHPCKDLGRHVGDDAALAPATQLCLDTFGCSICSLLRTGGGNVASSVGYSDSGPAMGSPPKKRAAACGYASSGTQLPWKTLLRRRQLDLNYATPLDVVWLYTNED